MNTVFAMLIGNLIGVAGPGVGALIALIAVRPKDTYLSFAMAASGGIMLAVTFFDMLPKALNTSIFQGLTSVFAGALFVYAAKTLMKTGRRSENQKSNYLNIGFLMALGIAVHNLPEGMAIGCGMSVMNVSSIGLSVAILLHDAPEGMAVALPMRMAGMSAARVLLVTLLSGLPTGVGALIGYAIGSVSDGFMHFCAGFAGGAMITLVFSEMLPDAIKISGKKSSFTALAAGMLIGAMIVLISNA